MANTKKNVLQLVPTSLTHNAGRYAERLDAAASDERELEGPPSQEMLTFAQAWAAIVDMCPPGVLKKSDTAIVQAAAREYQYVENLARIAGLEGRMFYAPDDKHTKMLAMLMFKLGGSPSDRGKVVIPKQVKPASDFD